MAQLSVLLAVQHIDLGLAWLDGYIFFIEDESHDMVIRACPSHA